MVTSKAIVEGSLLTILAQPCKTPFGKKTTGHNRGRYRTHSPKAVPEKRASDLFDNRIIAST